MKYCQLLFMVNAGPNDVKLTPSVLYEKCACLPEPGVMSAFTRSQMFPPETGVLAASLPVFVVFQLPSIVMLFSITRRVAPLSRLMPIHADESRNIARPERSPTSLPAP